MEHKSLSLKLLNTFDHLTWFWNLERIECFECVFGVYFLLLYWMRRVGCLDGLNYGGWGVFIAPTAILAIVVDGHTGQSGGAPDTKLFTVRCVLRQLTIRVWSYLLLNSSVHLVHRIVQCDLTSQTIFWLLTLLTTCAVALSTVG